MECSQVRKILFENADEEIPARDRDGVEAHLARCPSCARRFEALRGQSEALRSLPRLHAPANFLEHVRGRVEEPSPSAIDRVRGALSDFLGAKSFYKFVATAAAALLVVVSAQMVLKDSGVKDEARVVAPMLSAPPVPQPDSALPDAPAAPVVPGPNSSAPSGGFALEADSHAPRSSGTPAASAPQEPPAAGKMMKRRLDVKVPSPSSGGVLSSIPAQGDREELVALTLKIPPVSAAKQAAGGTAADDALRRPPAAGPGAAPAMKSVEASRPRMSQSKNQAKEETARLEQPPRTDPLQRVISELRRLIALANGKILSEPGAGSEKSAPLVTEIPAENYPEFLDRLRGLGETEFSGKTSESFAPRPETRVKVSVTFDSSP